MENWSVLGIGIFVSYILFLIGSFLRRGGVRVGGLIAVACSLGISIIIIGKMVDFTPMDIILLWLIESLFLFLGAIRGGQMQSDLEKKAALKKLSHERRMRRLPTMVGVLLIFLLIILIAFFS